jgi:predicted transcriptional regulator
MKDISPILNTLGLLDSEIKIYKTSLRVGATTVVDLAKKTNLSRQAIYTAIQNLIDRGLMSTVQSGKKRLFTAEDPDRLLEYAKRREDELKNQINDLKKALPELKLQSGGEKPVVRLYEGKEGVRVFLEDVKSVRPNEIDEITDLEALGAVLTAEDLKPLKSIAAQSKPKHRGMYLGKWEEKPGYDRISIPSKYQGFNSNITIYQDRVVLVTLEGKIYTIIIESTHLAKTLRILFDLVFEKK